jgi:imidazolonepropionase-like amidohydrolase
VRLFRASLVLIGPPGEVIEDGEVLVDGATIRHVGPRGSAETDDGVTIVDLKGCTILPGLIDCHVHVGFDPTVDPATMRSQERDSHLLLRMVENARKLVSAGVTTARDLGCRDFLDIELRDAIEAGLVLGPHLMCATRPLTHSGGHCWYMGGEADTAESVRRVARENLRAGADCLKIMATGGAMTPIGAPPFRAQYSTDDIRIVVEEAALRGKFVAAHAHGTRGIENAAAAGVRTIEHCSFSSEFTTGLTSQVDPAVMESVIQHNVYVCPTVSGALVRMRKDLGEQGLDCLLERMATMRAAGVKLIAGTDSGFGKLDRGFENRMDDYVSGLEVFAEAGWDPAAAIEAATVLAAEAIGIGELAGSLEIGKRADIIAVRGNPLRSLRDLRQLEMVLVSGRSVTQSAIETVASSGSLT